jgi:glutamate 5-kinase
MNDLHERDLLVVKVGTNTLVEHDEDYGSRLDGQSFENIGSQARELTEQGMGIILVSSGAITAGALGEQRDRHEIKDAVELQRYAARGWDTVVQRWKSVIGADRVSSTLLTKRELHTQKMRTKLLGVIACCLAHEDVFIVNENDTLSDDEIKFGDNDTLAGELAAVCAVAGLFKSVKLLLLTDKGGLNRVAGDDTTLIRTVTDIDAVAHYAGKAANGHSRGGMKTKIEAARTATNAELRLLLAMEERQTV